MSDRNLRHTLFSYFALVGKALSNGHRLELVDLMAQGERSVEDMARALGLSVANASQHLQQLLRVGLVQTRKDGLYVYYRLTEGPIIGLLSSMQDVARRNLADVQKTATEHLQPLDTIDALTRTQLLDRMHQNRTTIIDVRPITEFHAGHVAGAINLPLEELDMELSRLSVSDEIVAYCRGPYCTLAYEAVSILRKKGFTARRLEDGFPQWKHAGLPVETLN